jgi:hypothetical protein
MKICEYFTIVARIVGFVGRDGTVRHGPLNLINNYNFYNINKCTSNIEFPNDMAKKAAPKAAPRSGHEGPTQRGRRGIPE